MAPKYFLHPGLVKLRDEVNAAHKNRSKKSDGWIGDASHQAAKSDHNPDYDSKGIVRAVDITASGIDKARLIQVLINDPRTNYVISDRKIWSRKYGFRARAYKGANPHTSHVHASMMHNRDTDARPWGYQQLKVEPVAQHPAAPVDYKRTGPGGRKNVQWLQKHLHAEPDNSWGPDTDKRFLAVRDATRYHGQDFPFGVKFAQLAVGARVDGDWGPKSKAALMSTVRDIQVTLKNMGYTKQSPTGHWGADTERAFKAARRELKL